MNLLEAVFAVAIVAVVSGATLQAAVGAVRSAAGDPIRDALQARAADESHLALDVLKYDGSAIAPRAVATTIPLPTGTPLPVRMAISSAAQTGGGAIVTISVTDAGEPSESVTVTARLDARAPLPGSQQSAPGLVAAPTGAP
jgi:hypothetical protein